MPKVKILQEKVDDATGEFAVLLYDDEIVKKAIDRSTEDLPGELKEIVVERINSIIKSIRESAMDEISEYRKKEAKK